MRPFELEVLQPGRQTVIGMPAFILSMRQTTLTGLKDSSDNSVKTWNIVTISVTMDKSEDKLRFSKEADKNWLSLPNLEKAIPEKPVDALPIDSAVVPSMFKIDKAKKNNELGNGNSCCNFIRQNKKRILFWIEMIVLICICIAIAGGFTVPIIIYALGTNRANNTRSLSDFDLNSCSNTTMQIQVCTEMIKIH